MFTGIIESIGTISHISKNSNSSSLKIKPKYTTLLDDTKVGDSIATNGVCLTVTSLYPQYFTADVMSETMRVTTLSKLSVGELVNLERALKLSDRLGGHIVNGHVDGLGTISVITKECIATYITITADVSILKYIVNRGSVTIDGISLTVAELGDTFFKVSIIPHTGLETTLLGKKIGDAVNLENDVLAKYVERLLFFQKDHKKIQSSITEQFLRESVF